MKHQALRPAALMLSFLLLAAVPAKAGTVHFAEAVHTLSTGAAVDVRLRIAPQSGTTTVAQQSGQSGASSQQPSGTSTSGTTTTTTDATLSQSGGQVETVDLGDVTGTVCDCGEIPPPDLPAAGGFPWWPFLGVPLVCVSGICGGGEDEPPPPTCIVNCGPPPGPPIPEPATLLLFGTGLLALGARARRRYSRRRDSEVSAAEEVI